MKTITQFLMVFLVFITFGCDEQSRVKQLTDKEINSQLISLNYLLLDEQNEQVASFEFPYNESYLKKRHDLYEMVGEFISQGSQAYSQQQLNYLLIEERFSERYFPWSGQQNIVLRVLKSVDTKNINTTKETLLRMSQWIYFVKNQLVLAKQSKLFLNYIELKQLQKNILKAISLTNQFKQDEPDFDLERNQVLNALVSLEKELSAYKPSNLLGLNRLPNGAQWYQVKLNYFSNGIKAPGTWLSVMYSQKQKLTDAKLKLSQLKKANKTQCDIYSLNNAFISRIFSEHHFGQFNEFKKCSKSIGLDWRQDHIDIVGLLNQINRVANQIDDDIRLLYVVIALVDLGIHSQGWSDLHAKTFINKHIQLNNVQVNQLIEYVILHPAEIMMMAKYISV